MYKIQDAHRIYFIYLALTIVTFSVFWQVRDFEFTNYDDDQYVSENQHILTGFTFDNVKWLFTRDIGRWHPLTGLTHMLDCELFGLNAGWHHLTNLLLHIANTLLLFAVFKRATGALWQSAFFAALFAIHPFHVESVAWISGRKDVLSTLFWILTIGAYFRYVENHNLGWYAFALVTFALGLMAKPILVTLPVVLLLLDYWPLNRPELVCVGKNNQQEGHKIGAVAQWQICRRLILDKIPFFVVAGAAGIITFFLFRGFGVVRSIEALPLAVRTSNAVVSYVRYIGKMIWPARLAVIYPYSMNRIPYWQVVAAAVLLLVITVLVVRLAVKYRYLPVGWFMYLGTLVPVIGLIQINDLAMADRYTYLSLTGLFIIIAWGANDLLAKWRYRKIVLGVLSLGVISASGICAWFQTGYWRDSQSLFEHALKVTTGNYVACNNLAFAMIGKNEFNKAVNLLHDALRIQPDYLDAYNNLATAMIAQDKFDEAIGFIHRALQIKPDYAPAYNNLGLIYGKLGRLQDAIEAYGQAIKIAPDSFKPYYNLGVAFNRRGRYEEAIKFFKQAVKSNPGVPQVYYELGIIYGKLGRFRDEVEAYRNAIRIKPDYAEAYNNLGVACGRLGRPRDAIDAYLHAVKDKPDYAEAYNNLGVACSQLGRYQEAMQAFRKAILLKPDFAEAHCGLGICCLMVGDKTSAVKQYEILKTLDAEKANTLLGLMNE